MLVDINTKVVFLYAKLEELLPQSPNSPDVEDTSDLTQISLTIPNTGKLCTADCTVFKKVTWPHEVMFTPKGRPAVYKELSVMTFVRGYLILMDSQPQNIKALMDSHLTDLMENGEAYGWPVVRDVHSTWWQHIEMGRATWDDHATKLKLRRTLVWHPVASPMQGQSPNPYPKTQLPFRTAHRSPPNPCSETQKPYHPSHNFQKTFSPPANDDDIACTGYNMGLCHNNLYHEDQLHMCSFCLRTRGYAITQNCTATQNREGGSKTGSSQEYFRHWISTHQVCPAPHDYPNLYPSP